MEVESYSDAVAERRVRILYLIGGFLIIIGLMLVFNWFLSIDKLSPDFGQDYAAARGLLAGVSIYDVDPQNNHPPTTAILFLPLVFLPYLTALQFWTVLSTLLYLGILFCVARSLAISLPTAGWVLGLGIALCWYPFHAHLALGQISLLLSACLIGGWALLRQKRDCWAGLLFALAFMLKLFPGLIFIYLLLKGKWRAMSAAIVAIVIGWIVTILIVGLDDTIYYFQVVTSRSAEHYMLFPVNVSAVSLPSRFFLSGPWVEPITVLPEIIPYLTGAIGLTLAFLLAWHIWRTPSTRQGEDRAFALVCVAMPLLSPISWQHIFPLLSLPFGLLFVAALQRECERERLRILIALYVIFILISLPDIQLANLLMSFYVPFRMPWYTALLLTLPTLAIFSLWYMLLKIARPVDEVKNKL